MTIGKEEVDRVLERWQTAKSDRSSLESAWQDLAQLFRPSEADITGERSAGNGRQERLYSGHQIGAAEKLARSIEAELMPRDEPWVEITTEEEVEAEDDDAAEWLDEAGQALVRAIYEPKAGFERHNTQVLNDFVVFGAGVGWCGESRDLSRLNFNGIHLKHAWWLRDEAGNADTMFLRDRLTARQAAQRWTFDNLSPEVRQLLTDNKPETKREFLQVAMPREDYRARPGLKRPLKATELPYATYVIETETRHLVREGGDHEFPYVVPEWAVMDGGDIWSPGRRALPDAKVLQQQMRTLLRSGQRAADPPILLTSKGVVNKLDLRPGGVSYFDSSTLGQGQKLIERIDVGANMPITLELIKAQMQALDEIFLIPVLQLPDQPNMTATEVMRRGTDLLRLTSAVFGSVETGLSQPLVERCFYILLRASERKRFGEGSPFKEPPKSLQGKDLRFKFLSPVARARKMQQVGSLGQMLAVLTPLIELKPSAGDNIDADELIRDVVTEMTSAKFLVPKDERDQMRQRQAQEAHDQQAAALLAQGAQAAGHIAGAVSKVAPPQPPANQQQPPAPGQGMPQMPGQQAA